MPTMKPRRYLATDHRAVVLESVATAPTPAILATVVADCATESFPAEHVGKMVWQLRREGLISRRDDGSLHITASGLDYLTRGRFDRALPAPHERPRGRKPRK